MAPDLLVTAELLTDLVSAMNELRQHFETVEGQGADAVEEVSAWADLRSALNDFQNNWDQHRRSLIDSLAGFAEAATGVDQALSDADTELAGALEAEE